MNSERFVLMDLLRFILAIIVVFYHYFYLSTLYGLTPKVNSNLEYLYICGYLGVHVFFIVSGFVILHTAKNRDIFQFIKARVNRLLPGFMIVSLIGFLFSLLIPNVPHTNNIYLKDFIFNFSGLSIFPKVNNLFNINFIDDSMWSLRYEAGFYILISIMLFFNKIKSINYLAYFWIVLSILRNEFYIPILNKIPTNLISADYSFFFCMGILIYLIFYNNDKNKITNFVNIMFLLISTFFALKFVYIQMQTFKILNFQLVTPMFAVLYFLFFFALFLVSIADPIIKKNIFAKNIFCCDIIINY
jgi:peptidoglycan/LPS O-acetylase OafA/YrhL